MHSRASRSAGEGQRLAPGAAHLGASDRRRLPGVRFPGVEQPTATATEDRKSVGGAAGCRTSLQTFAAFGSPAPRWVRARVQPAHSHVFFVAPGDTRNRAPAAGRGTPSLAAGSRLRESPATSKRAPGDTRNRAPAAGRGTPSLGAEGTAMSRCQELALRKCLTPSLHRTGCQALIAPGPTAFAIRPYKRNKFLTPASDTGRQIRYTSAPAVNRPPPSSRTAASCPRPRSTGCSSSSPSPPC